MQKAVFREIENEEPVFGEIPPCPGVWATGRNVYECRKRLEEALEGWLLLGIRFGDPLPEIDGIRIDVPEPSPASD